MLATVDIKGKRLDRDRDRDQRRTQALEDLRRGLNAKPRTFLIDHPVACLAADGLPRNIGSIHVTIFGPTERALFQPQIDVPAYTRSRNSCGGNGLVR